MEIVDEIKICKGSVNSLALFDLCVGDAGTELMWLVPVQEAKLTKMRISPRRISHRRQSIGQPRDSL